MADVYRQGLGFTSTNWSAILMCSASTCNAALQPQCLTAQWQSSERQELQI